MINILGQIPEKLRAPFFAYGNGVDTCAARMYVPFIESRGGIIINARREFLGHGSSMAYLTAEWNWPIRIEHAQTSSSMSGCYQMIRWFRCLYADDLFGDTIFTIK